MKQNIIPWYEFIKNKFKTANMLYHSLLYNKDKFDMTKIVSCLVNNEFQQQHNK